MRPIKDDRLGYIERWPAFVADRLSVASLFMNLNLNFLQHLTFHVAFNKNLKASKASGASEAGQVFQPVRAKQAGAWGPV